MTEYLCPILKNNNPTKEHILLFGVPGIGKTHIFFTIAKWHQDLGSDAMFYGISTDNSYDVLSTSPQFEDLENITWRNVREMYEYYNAAKEFSPKLRAQDWMSLDLNSSAWDAAQDEFVNLRGKELMKAQKIDGDLDDLGDFWLHKADTTKYPMEGWSDWQFTNARLRRLRNNYLTAGPGHRFVINSQAKVQEPTPKMREKEDELVKQRREMFAHLGVMPTGQKEDPFSYDSILHLSADVGPGGIKRQYLATAKERWPGRRWMGTDIGQGNVRGEPIEDFYMDYLVKVAGWKI